MRELFTPLPEDKFNRLPKFAQEYIRDLERRVTTLDTANAELHAMTDADTETQVIANPFEHMTGERALRLPSDTHIEFNLNPNVPRGDCVRAHITEGRVKGVPVLEIQADSGVELVMNSSNSFYIKFPERRR